MKTIKELRQAGFTVKVRHNRKTQTVRKMDGEYERPLPKGGFTEVNIYHELGHLLGSGYSACCDIDNYSRRVGKDIAFGRALKNANIKNIVESHTKISVEGVS